MNGWRGQGCLYARVNEVRKRVPWRIEWMKDLFLPHRVHRPSRILLNVLSVANHLLHLLVFLEKGRYEEVLSNRRLAQDEDNICWY